MPIYKKCLLDLKKKSFSNAHFEKNINVTINIFSVHSLCLLLTKSPALHVNSLVWTANDGLDTANMSLLKYRASPNVETYTLHYRKILLQPGCPGTETAHVLGWLKRVTSVHIHSFYHILCIRFGDFVVKAAVALLVVFNTPALLNSPRVGGAFNKMPKCAVELENSDLIFPKTSNSRIIINQKFTFAAKSYFYFFISLFLCTDQPFNYL